MSINDLEQIAQFLLNLRRDWGLEAASAAFKHRAIQLPPEQQTQLAALVFGTDARFDINVASLLPIPTKGSHGDADISGGSITGPVVGQNTGIIYTLFGGVPPRDARELISNYYRMLIKRYDALHMSRLLANEESGRDEPSAPSLSLMEVFVSLTTNRRMQVAPFETSPRDLLAALDAADPTRVTPEQVRLAALSSPATSSGQSTPPGRVTLTVEWAVYREQIELVGNEPSCLTGDWYRPELVVEAVAQAPRLVLLGDPGYGKSTILRYLTVRLAQTLQADRTTLEIPGWHTITPLPIPFFCSLGQVAQRMSNDASNDTDHLIAEILAPVESTIRAGLRENVLSIWRRGSGLLLLDGLDEAPNVPEAVHINGRNDLRSRRERLIDAILDLSVELGDSRVVVTCRTKPYEQSARSLFSDEWQVRRVEPLAFGQVRAFVSRWYAQACCRQDSSKYQLGDIEVRSGELLVELEQQPRLREIAASPLLLTMLALLHYNQTRLPEERADVCEALVQLLLERWEGVRSANDGQPHRWRSLAEILELPSLTTNDLEHIRAIVQKLALEAHGQEGDNCGSIPGRALKDALDLFFARKIDPHQPERLARSTYTSSSDRFLRFLCEESGLLLPDGEMDREDTYVLPHLLLQEYLAACFLAEQQKAVELALGLWRSNGERWREPLLLLMARLARLTKVTEIKGWFKELTTLAMDADEEPSIMRRSDHLRFAEECYQTLGGHTGLFVSFQRANIPTDVAPLRKLTHDLASSAAIEREVTKIESWMREAHEKLPHSLASESDIDRGEGAPLPVVVDQTTIHVTSPASPQDQRQQIESYLRALSHALFYLPLGVLEPQQREIRVPLPEAYIELDISTPADQGGSEVVLIQSLATIMETVPQLVLLGDPGSGKSTALRHLSWSLAQKGLEALETGTSDVVLPILLPLPTLANWISRNTLSRGALLETAKDALQSYYLGEVDDLLRHALYSGAVFLLLDGLDEVSLEERLSVLRVIMDFSQIYPKVRIVVTCRLIAFDERQRQILPWPQYLLKTLTVKQIHAFVNQWFNVLVRVGQLPSDNVQRATAKLISAIVANPRLESLAKNPLFLTMMSNMVYTKGNVARDRAWLYEDIVKILLDYWDIARGGRSLAETVGLSNLTKESLRYLLDSLAYRAFSEVRSVNGFGRLSRQDVRDALITFFDESEMPKVWEIASRCLNYFERSGLLVRVDEESYAFAHLTLQEYCAGRALVFNSDATFLIMQHRADTRWREPIFLGLAVAQQINPPLIDRVMSDLIDLDEGGAVKSLERRQRDLILAAEIGQDRDWIDLRTQGVNVQRLQRDLRRGLVELVNDRLQTLPISERVNAGSLLGHLGDPRFPVTIDEWQREIERVLQGETNGYFCCIEAGPYYIGSSEDDRDARENEKPRHAVQIFTPVWIGRYPLTNVQWHTFIEGAGPEASSSVRPEFNLPNQPIVEISWDGAKSFCDWLSKQLGVEVRLPTEVEWEVAARGSDARRYPWGDTWFDDRAATLEDQPSRGWAYTVPVGCYPAGAATCGALDMVGNVWEWTSDVWHLYPGATTPTQDERYRVRRGGTWMSDKKSARCAARGRHFPEHQSIYYGMRVVVVLNNWQQGGNAMADPITLGVIVNGLVGAYKAYTEYKAAVVKAKADQKEEPTKTEEAAKGEQVAQVIETGIQQHGKADEQTALAGYQQNPQLFEPVLTKVIADVASRNSAFAGQLQTLALQANIQTGGAQGKVEISGEGKV